MQVKVTREFRAVPAGAVYPKEFLVDEIVDGRIAEIALELKSGEKIAGSVSKERTHKTGETAPAANSTTNEDEDEDEDEDDETDGEAQTAGGDADPPAGVKKPEAPKTIIVRARLKDKYEGPDDKGKAIKIVKGGVVSAPLAQKLVDEGLAVVLETKPA
ncbi:hypothetical protein Hden_2976 [Hyphomicrobium denitrificans ATCC 51888]|uniref:Uncharacterized protein n=1 Tax=Hyphomicrobium denitrificans (strain ATCC 51888 / DSM 1869 / NCIMB 11706 / TK 0415) TaxID=582899 RepID=D8JVB7_HYPDA|nr:hypothetical protein [Hyphomicrobium denitrificans]ADJ24771.1 hypothetical protein Hden_2976 [Hyphomicrobium denitrificans ATCC 51888]